MSITGPSPSLLGPPRSLAMAGASADETDESSLARMRWWVAGSIVVASGSELLGRFFRLAHVGDSMVQGLLTLFALAVLGLSSVLILRRVHHLRKVTRITGLGAFLLIFSQVLALGGSAWFAGLVPFARNSLPLHEYLEEVSFVVGLAFVVGGFYQSIFDADRAKTRLERETQDLVHEIAERHQAEQALRSSEERFRAILGATSDGVWDATIRPDGQLAGSRHWGHNGPDEATAPTEVNWIDSVHPEDREGVRAALAEHLAGSTSEYRAEFRLAEADGSWRWVLSRGKVIQRDKNNRPSLIVGTHTDISRRKEAEAALRQAYSEVERRVEERTARLQEANRRLEEEIAERVRAETTLRQSEERFRGLVEGLSDAVYRMSLPDGRYEYLSPAAIDVFGYSAREFMEGPLSIREIIHPDYADYFQEMWKGLVQGRMAPRYEYKVTDPEGCDRWILQSNRFIQDEEGRVVAVEGICRNITEQRRAQQVVEEHRVRLLEASKMSLLGEMAANIAHEINNPLNIISGSAEQLQKVVNDPCTEPAIVSRLSQTIVHHVFRIKDMVHGLRHFTRDASGDSLQATPLRTLVHDTVVLCTERFAAMEVALAVDDVADDLVVECRPTQLMEVLANLLNNALDAVENQPQRWVSIGVEKEPGHVVIRVVDSGPGVPPALRETLFDPLVTSKPPGKGMGLGLTISRRIVQNHNGTLTRAPEAAHTTFSIRLPRKPSGADVEV